MEHHNATTSSTNLRQQQHQTREQLSQKIQDQLHQQQQTHINNNTENQQQFCLRWHNHQTSLLSTLPILLDQSHLTDVTISAEGRTLRAHRVVLSACSSFFLEIFRTLETTHHPVIIIPGASFNAIVSLLTFMYSGEVNVYEEQIPMLLSLAETLGIKGLADVHNNLQKPPQKTSPSNDKELLECKKEDIDKSHTPTTSCSPPTQSACGNFSLPQTPPIAATNLSSSSFNPLIGTGLNSKFPSPLENFFLKSLQFYPNLMHQPLNFSQTALNKTELLAKYQQHLYQANLGMTNKDLIPSLMNTEEEAATQLAKRFCSGLEKKSSLQLQQNPLLLQQQKDIKRIDKIVENLRAGGVTNSKAEKSPDNVAGSPLNTHLHNPLAPLSIKTSLDNYNSSPHPSPVLAASKTSSLFPSLSSQQNTETTADQLHSQLGYNISPEDQLKLQQHLDKYAQSCVRSMEAAANENLKNEAARMMANEKHTATTVSPQTKPPSNSKLYATCFICHKQLSNQYNLRVHLETHQNVRYACNVCSHVSRSKDALRKHVSYRHPGAPSPCETEARRKRANKVLATQFNAAANLAHNSPSSGEITPTSPNALAHFQTAATPTTSTSSNLNCSDSSAPLTAAQLSSAYQQMFLPNQFHLAAAAASSAQQQQQQASEQQQKQQQSCSTSQMANSSATTLMSVTTNDSPSMEKAKFNLNNSSVAANNPNSTTTTSSNNPPNELQSSTNTNNSSGEARISPNLNT